MIERILKRRQYFGMRGEEAAISIGLIQREPGEQPVEPFMLLARALAQRLVRGVQPNILPKIVSTCLK
ncbi:hypothetical protein [Stakelama flava]|uniref:hypothetical protein n=1 Tax=Stakelama flava TaxID=2860338 RepID=UPI001FE6FDCB|nr:hypothetical protein [Stakelama flava]